MENNNEILEVESQEVSNDPLQIKITEELAKANITDAVVNAIADTYGNVRLVSVDDPESYLECKAASKDIRRIEIIGEKICEKGREMAIKEQRSWIQAQKTLLLRTGKTKSPIDADIKRYEDNQDRIRQEEKKRQEELFIKRQSELLKYGAKYENGSFILDHISYESINIQEADEEVYTQIILPKYYKQFEINQQAIVAQEKERAEAAAKLKLEQDALAKEREEFKLQQENMRLQQQQMDNQRLETERLQRVEQDRIRDEEDAKTKALYNKRAAVLSGLGMTFNGSVYSFEGVDVAAIKLSSITEEAWIGIIQEITPQISKLKADAETKRLSDLEVLKQQAIDQEKEKQELLKKQQLQQKEEELAKASDKEKWVMFIGVIKELLPPTTMRSSIYKSKVQMCKEKLEEIVNL